MSSTKPGSPKPTMQKKSNRKQRSTSVKPNPNPNPAAEESITSPPASMDGPESLKTQAEPDDERLGATVPLPALADILPDAPPVKTGPPSNGTGPAGEHQPTRLSCQQVEASFLSDVGQIRDNNEDSVGAFLSSIPRGEGEPELLFGFLVVADGMGGHERGEVASNMAVKTLTEGVLRDFYLPTLKGEQPGRNGDSPVEVLRGLVQDTNQAILQEAHQNRVQMGTTLTCAVLLGKTALIGHVGDSRLYVLEKSTGRLRQITHDHSVVQRLVDMGQISPEDAANSPQRSVLYMSLGQRAPLEADIEVLSLNDVSSLLVCSDGLWDMLEDFQIEHILRTTSGPAETATALIKAANEAGGLDNVTVIVANV